MADKKAHLDFTKIDSFTDSSAESSVSSVRPKEATESADKRTDSSAGSSVSNYQQVLGSSNQKFQEKMVLSAWEYRVYKK